MSLSKRMFDLFWSVLGLVVLFPVFVVIALLIKVEDGGPALFQQERVGHRGKRFMMLKFRTMVQDGERRGLQLTVGGDPRITRVGHLLRKTKIDELPQLINVVRGEMSLVGPRPEVPRYVALYSAKEQEVLDFVPGITDPASIAYRDEADVLARSEDPEGVYIAEVMPAKIAINVDYGRKATVFSDFVVILETVGLLARDRVKFGRG